MITTNPLLNTLPEKSKVNAKLTATENNFSLKLDIFTSSIPTSLKSRIQYFPLCVEYSRLNCMKSNVESFNFSSNTKKKSDYSCYRSASKTGVDASKNNFSAMKKIFNTIFHWWSGKPKLKYFYLLNMTFWFESRQQ